MRLFGLSFSPVFGLGLEQNASDTKAERKRQVTRGGG